MAINSIIGLKSYALAKLGNGIIEVNVTAEQIDYCLDDAIQKFNLYHSEGYLSTWTLLTVTKGTAEYEIDHKIIGVTGIIPDVYEITAGGEPTFTAKWDFMMEKRYTGELDLVGYEILMEKIDLLNFQFIKQRGFVFNRSAHKITFYPAPEENRILALKVYAVNDPYDYTDIYNNEWLKNYFVALLRIQWADNLTKVVNVPMPGGGLLNMTEILNRGLADKASLEEELAMKHEEPPEFILG